MSFHVKAPENFIWFHEISLAFKERNGKNNLQYNKKLLLKLFIT